MLRPHGAQAAIQMDQRIEHHETDQRSHHHDLEDVQLARRLAAGHRHDQHAGEPARHPECGFDHR
jgi:hypothetical protein